MKKVETLFFENPKLDTEIYTFCKSNQEYNQAESAYEAMMGDLRAKLGFQETEEIEECFLEYLSQLAHVYYLFGLGLRQEVLWALGRE